VHQDFVSIVIVPSMFELQKIMDHVKLPDFDSGMGRQGFHGQCSEYVLLHVTQRRACVRAFLSFCSVTSASIIGVSRHSRIVFFLFSSLPKKCRSCPSQKTGPLYS
jgi:hypothetical protein